MVGFEALKHALESITEATHAEELATAKLAFSLKAIGDSSEGTKGALEAQAALISQQLPITEAHVKSLQAQALMYGILPENIDRVTRAALDLAKAEGTDEASAMQEILRALDGHISRRSFLGHQLDANKVAVGGLNAVLEALAPLEGQAAAEAQTAEGRHKQFDVALEHLSVTIGQKLGGRGGAFEIATEAVKKFETGLMSLFGIAELKAKEGAAWASALVDVFSVGWPQAFENLKDNLKEIGQEGQKAVEALDKTAEEGAKAAEAILGKGKNQKSAISDEYWKKINDDADAALKKLGEAHQREDEENAKARERATAMKEKWDEEDQKEDERNAKMAQEIMDKAFAEEEEAQRKHLEKMQEDVSRLGFGIGKKLVDSMVSAAEGERSSGRTY